MIRGGSFAKLLALVVCAILPACALMPTSGPLSEAIRSGQTDPESLPYALVRLTPHTVNILGQATPRLSTIFNDRRGPTETRFGVGDIVTVTIFEAGAGGLFIPQEAGVRPGNFITLPPQAVDSLGNISVPYAGAVLARGRTPVEVQQAIVAALKNRALDPQAIVTLSDQRASSISVLGDGIGSVRFPAVPSGERILDAITRAGMRAPGFDLWVMLERQGRRATVPFGALIYEPANNIYVRPQDTIFVYREPQTFVAFGASGRQGQFNFEAWRISLSEATAKAGGLNDNLADPASVFVYRGETRRVAELLGADISKFEGPIIPIIYQINLRDPAGYFLSTKFEIRNKDVLYISNSFSVETSKFLGYLRLIIATAQDPIYYAVAVRSLTNTAAGGSTTIVTTPLPPAAVP